MTQRPSFGHCCVSANMPGSESGVTFSGISCRLPLTTPMAVAVSCAFSGSPQPVALMVSTAFGFAGFGAGFGVAQRQIESAGEQLARQRERRKNNVFRILPSLLWALSGGEDAIGAREC